MRRKAATAPKKQAQLLNALKQNGYSVHRKMVLTMC